MAFLRRQADGKTIPVPSRMLAGRSPSSSLRLESSAASSEHASLTWNGETWELRDLASRNGTYLDGDRLEPGRALETKRGARIMFGDRAEDWTLIDAAAPELIAIDLESGLVIPSSSGMLALPHDEALEASIYRNAEGAFVVESAEGVRTIESEQVIRTPSGAFRLFLPVESEGTPMIEGGPRLADVTLRFAVTLDEEHVQITVLHQERKIALESREHGYLLLTLARARTADRELPLGQRGWIDREALEKMLAIDTNTLAVWVYRARQQLLEAGIEGAQGIVEVRPKQRRLGTERFEVVSL